MAYNTKKMLEDSNGDLIPQYWDIVEQEFKPLTGSDGAQDTRLTGSIVDRFNLADEFGNIPAGTSKEVVGEGFGGSIYGFAHSTNFNMYKAISVFYRRSKGELDSVRVVFGGVNSVSATPRVTLDFPSSTGRLGVSEKIDLLTNDFKILVKATDEEDLVFRNFYVYLWRY